MKLHEPVGGAVLHASFLFAVLLMVSTPAAAIKPPAAPPDTDPDIPLPTTPPDKADESGDAAARIAASLEVVGGPLDPGLQPPLAASECR